MGRAWVALMARRVPTSPDRHISSWIPSCPLPAMAQCRHSENETTLYWGQSVDILIQELKDHRDNRFFFYSFILDKWQEASHHSFLTREANGLFKMLPQRSTDTILFFPTARPLKYTKMPSFIVCIQPLGLDVSAVPSIYTEHLPAQRHLILEMLNPDIWLKNKNRGANNAIKPLTLCAIVAWCNVFFFWKFLFFFYKESSRNHQKNLQRRSWYVVILY